VLGPRNGSGCWRAAAGEPPQKGFVRNISFSGIRANVVSQGGQFDGWGQTLWAYGQHYRITHDKAFAEWALPQIDRAVDWLKQACAADPLHIIPASDVRDNEFVPGHLTGYNFLALSGLKLAIEMASDTGHADLAQKWQAEYDDYHKAFFKVLEESAGANNGYIPPALDGQKGGYDWGNLLAVVSPTRCMVKFSFNFSSRHTRLTVSSVDTPSISSESSTICSSLSMPRPGSQRIASRL